jgi:hemerythrin-like domain-containing protein
MNPTEVLSSEHRVIEIVLSCLERMTDEALRNGKLDSEPAEQVIDIIRNFADKCHHGKEEDLLFKVLVEKGMPREGGPIGQMLLEHEQGRTFVRGMSENIPAATAGEAAAVRRFAENARGYFQLLSAHINKEDRILFPMADRLLSDDDQRKLSESFARLESEHMGEGTHTRYLTLAANLAKRYGVPHEILHNASCGCGH